MDGVTSSRDVIIRTERWEEALRFYGATLGFPVANRNPGMVGFDAGAIRLFVERGPGHGPVFDFLVEDVVAARDRLVGAGCTVIEEDPAVPRCYLRDPFGMVFNLGLTACT